MSKEKRQQTKHKIEKLHFQSDLLKNAKDLAKSNPELLECLKYA